MVRGKTVWMIATGSLGLTAVAACGSTHTATATPVSTPAVKTSPTPKPVDVAAAEGRDARQAQASRGLEIVAAG